MGEQLNLDHVSRRMLAELSGSCTDVRGRLSPQPHFDAHVTSDAHSEYLIQ